MYVKATGKADKGKAGKEAPTHLPGKGKAGKDSPTHVPTVSPTIEVSTYL